VLVVVCLVAQLITAILPPGKSGYATAEYFFKQYLALPVVIFFWIVGYLWKRKGMLKLDQIDIDTGRREHDWEVINAYRAKYATYPKWKKVLSKIF
jgi:amino acid transporter